MTMSNLQNYYLKEVLPKLKTEFKIKNPMAVPKLTKIVVNIGLGEALVNKNALEHASSQLSKITGQKPKVTHAKKDISTFKVRKGDAIGLKVTLRGERMHNFYEKLVKIVLPRIRDFRGIDSSSIDEKGNFSLGLKEQIVFPEVGYDEVDKTRGLEMAFVTTGKTKIQVKKLLELLGMPFKKS